MYLKRGDSAESGLKSLGSPAGDISALFTSSLGIFFLSQGLFSPNHLSLPRVITARIAAYGAVWLCCDEGVPPSSVLGTSTA